ncbi:YlmH/Sll1252 family protein [Lacrimispora sp. NSJ-141]|uniref:YlmH/Sll1252 family protein n=1 Tax=Lientehia hominis TaxID=2897778 RepID=A0AAP2RGY2_9FIRM|nr:YlmH/Sll1252 family protein [Lientehia hominis]MCD2491058.1 YlmH/Sll1252 family protein [Lientehia hominis]
MDREEQLFLHRLHDLSDACFQRGIPVYTDFLNLHEQTVFLSALPEFSHVRCYLDGGYETAERKIVCFLPVYGGFEEGPDREQLPIVPVRISSSAGKFTVPSTHRDYLGAVLNLGIERGKIGDIIVGDGFAYCLCTENMSDFLMEELKSVRRNPVACTRASFADLEENQSFTVITGSIASLRMDALLALLMKCSRSRASECLAEERVFLNGKLCVSQTAVPKTGDILSVRGVGKYIFDGVLTSTKKGRQMVQLKKYD